MQRLWNILEVVVALVAHYGFGVDFNGTEEPTPVESGQVVPRPTPK